MQHLDARAIHGIPAFFVGLFVGAFFLGTIIWLWNATVLFDMLKAPIGGLLASAYSLLYAPAAALIYIPIFLVLRGFKFINLASFAVGGAILGFLLSEPWSADHLINVSTPFWFVAMSISGAVGGFASYWTLRRCKDSDES